MPLRWELVCATDQTTFTYPNLCEFCKRIAPQSWDCYLQLRGISAPPAKDSRLRCSRSRFALVRGSMIGQFLDSTLALRAKVSPRDSRLLLYRVYHRIESLTKTRWEQWCAQDVHGSGAIFPKSQFPQIGYLNGKLSQKRNKCPKSQFPRIQFEKWRGGHSPSMSMPLGENELWPKQCCMIAPCLTEWRLSHKERWW